MHADPRWSALPPELGQRLAAGLDAVAAELVAVVRDEVPLYSRPLEGSFGRGISLGVREGLRQFCLLVETGGKGETGGLGVYEELGRGEWRQGRPLDTLLAAYRVGARVAWRRFALIAAEGGIGTEGLVALAELVFAHIDELSGASAHGYAAEQFAQAGERDRRRQAVLRLLLAPAVDRESVLAAARLASWPVPAALRAVVAPAGTSLAALGPDALVDDGDPVVAVVAAAGSFGRLAGLAAVGPVCDIDGLATSRDRATAMLDLRRRGLVPADGVFADDHLPALVLWADTGSAQALADRVLGPLDAVPEPARVRLEETLRAWLLHAGERAAAARSLHVHPQTVRYRMGQVRELLGHAVDDPRQRLALLLAVEVRAGTGTAVRQ